MAIVVKKNKLYTPRELWLEKIIPGRKKQNYTIDHNGIIKLMNMEDPIRGLHGRREEKKGGRYFYTVEGIEVIRFLKDNYPEIEISII